ncbi:Serine/threonine-protein kinase PknB [Stieleria neptunia]|uniref:non-specific serine/threonine protein kinase n=1 Tax=Stieleria neptunia TaxID=2527979 RepID=A0A518HJE0_9BACT|nr:serine/threonine-protein kinase [Stieleria neptunia]QDV40968.1 Serine/threonine-protein kinase PknB [Stieleria neptunia]
MVAANLPPRDESRGLHCDEAILLRLLDETLSEHQQSIAEDHLATCHACQHRLETLAGDATLWTETRSVYGRDEPAHDERLPVTETAPATGHDADATQAWLRAIAAPPRENDPACLGRIDRYRIDSVIGSGGMGVVASGFDDQLGRPVAIKFLASHLAGLAPARRRFTREARAAAAIVHPSIMPIYGVSEKSHPPYLVMPLIGSSSAGRSLQCRIDQEGPLDLETALGIAAQIAEGLAAAHQRGVVHRDIKPGNILLEENSPRILIADFGLARAIDDATVTVSGMVAGTPQYMSPEQAAGEDVGPRSDLFSLGSVLYSMLTGRPPFVADSPIAVLRKVIDTPASPVVDRVESLPPWVERLVQRFLCKAPAQRIASAIDAAQLLRQAEAHVRHPSANPLPVLLQRPRMARGRSVIAALFAVAALAILFALAKFPWIGTSPRSPSTTPVTREASAPPRPATTITTGPSIESKAPREEASLSWQWEGFADEIRQIQLGMNQLENDIGFPPVD